MSLGSGPSSSCSWSLDVYHLCQVKRGKCHQQGVGVFCIRERRQHPSQCLRIAYCLVEIIAVMVLVETSLVSQMMGRGAAVTVGRVVSLLPRVSASTISKLSLALMTGVSPWVMNFILSELGW